MSDDAIAYHQTASWLFRHGQQGELNGDEFDRVRRIATAARHADRN